MLKAVLFPRLISVPQLALDYCKRTIDALRQSALFFICSGTLLGHHFCKMRIWFLGIEDFISPE